MRRLGAILTSKTVWGTVAAVSGYLSQQAKIGVQEGLIAAGIVITAIGLKDGQHRIEQKVR